MLRAQIHLCLLLLATLLLSSCGRSSEQQKPEINLNEIFPEHLAIIDDTAWRFDVDHDGKKEWLILYEDVQVANVQGSPVIGAVFWPVDDLDSRMAPVIVPALLWLPSQGYVCFGTCKPDMWNAITENPRDELIVLDKQGEGTVGVAFFHWQEELNKKSNDGCMPPWAPFRAACVPGGFVPLGHFRGDLVVVDPNVPDRVTVIHRHYDRSDLATQEVYSPKSGRYYLDDVQTVYEPGGQLYPPDEAEVIFASGPPEEPIQVKLPEKLVLSFYHNYANLTEIQRYFTSQAWLRTGQDCANGICGCSFNRNEVARVMVKQIAYESNFQQTTQVVAQVICLHKNGDRDAIANRVWTLRRQSDETWRLADVAVGGEAYLCPRTGCQVTGGGE